MILLALLLSTLGAADLVRNGSGHGPVPGMIRMLSAGGVVLALGIWGTGLDWWWFVIGLGTLAIWAWSTRRVMTAASGTYPWPVIGLIAVILAILAAGSHTPVADGWLTQWYAGLGVSALAGVSFDTFVLTLACLVFLIDTSNVIVRMVLTGTGARNTKGASELKGGRMLGPIERIFIFAMALAGQYLAVTAVIAAKGILRFPEIAKDSDMGTKAEYVLVGSFVSWGIAFAFLPLL